MLDGLYCKADGFCRVYDFFITEYVFLICARAASACEFCILCFPSAGEGNMAGGPNKR